MAGKLFNIYSGNTGGVLSTSTAKVGSFGTTSDDFYSVNFELYKDQIGLNEIKTKSIKFSKKLLENTIKYILEEYIKQKLSIKYDYNEYFKLDENLFIIKSYEKGHKIRFTKNQKLNLDKVIILLIEYEIIDEETFKITKIYFKKKKEFK